MVTPARSERLASDGRCVRSVPGEVARAIFRRREGGRRGNGKSAKKPFFSFLEDPGSWGGEGGKERFLGWKREKEQGEKYTGKEILPLVFPGKKLENIAPKMNKKVDELIFRCTFAKVSLPPFSLKHLFNLLFFLPLR